MHKTRNACMRYAALAMAVVIGIGGCDSFQKTRRPAQPPASPSPLNETSGLTAAVMGDTVGGVAYLRSTRWIAVKGYGLVVGLGRNGSRECPEPLRRQLIQEITKWMQTGGVYDPGRADIKAAELIDDPDTAVVEVNGILSPGMCEGTRFDVTVTAVPGTTTRSLAGGRLYSCDLHMYRFDATGGTLQGRTVATAAGPIFPLDTGQEEKTADPRTGIVLGGGRNLVSRTMEVVLTAPSHRLAREITNRINESFGSGDKIAEPANPAVLRVKAPKAWVQREEQFYELLMHLPLARHEQYLIPRARTLIDMLKDADAPAEDIALVLEAMGQPAVTAVQGFYADPSRAVRYYCARVGLRLRDDLAVDVLRREALDAGSPFREAAVAELARASDVAIARLPLRELLNEADPKIRLLAYQGLAKHRDEKLQRYRVGVDATGQPNFILDVVPSSREPLIYATRTLEPRLAIIGEAVACQPPLFYMHPDRVVTISADAGQHEVTLVRRAYGRVSEPMKSPCDLAQLLRFLGDIAEPDKETGQIRGLGLLYSQVVDVAAALSRSQAVAARLELQKELARESLGAVKPPIRPESEIEPEPVLPPQTQQSQ